MKVFKFFEGWASIADNYLINNDVENEAMVKRFIEFHHLNNLVYIIWQFGKKECNTYPNKITNEEILYLLEGGYKVIISITSGMPTHMKKFKMEYINTTFKPIIQDKGEFSLDRLKEYLTK